MRRDEPQLEPQDVAHLAPPVWAEQQEARSESQHSVLNQVPEQRVEPQELHPEPPGVAERWYPPQPVVVQWLVQLVLEQPCPSSRLPSPLLQQLLLPLPRGNACARVPHDRDQASSSASSSP